MISRITEPLVRQRLAQYPAVLLIGPRQCGKTTLAKQIGTSYFDLEQSADRLRVDLEWKAITDQNNTLVFDEAQSMPDLFPRLRGAIDSDRSHNGRFLLLGSVAPSLMTKVSESLAGRLALVELTPFCTTELPQADVNDLWLYGGFPQGGCLNSSHFPQWQRDYLDLLCQRDLPAWGLPATPQVTRRLLEMAGALQGQNWNASQLGQSLGLSYHTINSYADYLEGAFITRRVQPYFTSAIKRLSKTPRFYIRDSGLLHALMGVGDQVSLMRQPWVGASWEGFVIEEILRLLKQRGRDAQPFFFRTHDGQELDLLLVKADRIWAFEIKMTTSPTTHDLRHLNSLADLLKAQKRFLVSQTPDSVGGDKSYSCNLPWLLEYVGTNWT